MSLAFIPVKILGLESRLNEDLYYAIDLYFKLSKTYTDVKILFYKTDWTKDPDKVHFKKIDIIKSLLAEHNLDFSNCFFLLDDQDISKEYYFPEVLENHIFLIEYFLLKEYTWTQYNKHNLTWNTKGKPQIIFGKLYRPHRYNSLVSLANAGVLDTKKYNWSLDVPRDELREKHIERGVDLDLVKKFSRKMKHDNEVPPHTGYPYSEKIFKNALFSVVLETFINEDFPLISEKTWKPISNRVPYLGIYSEWQKNKLNIMGFCDFTEYYLGEQEFNPMEISENLSEYSEKFEQELKKNIDQVKKQVKHNGILFNQLGEQVTNDLDIFFKSDFYMLSGRKTTFLKSIIFELETSDNIQLPGIL